MCPVEDAAPTVASADSKLCWLSGSLISQAHVSFTRGNEGHRTMVEVFCVSQDTGYLQGIP